MSTSASQNSQPAVHSRHRPRYASRVDDSRAEFSVGQVIHHQRFGYRGVIADVDATFHGSDEWYDQVARSRPPRDKPWYHVLVDGSDSTTYVAERHLEPDQSGGPIQHPLLEQFFESYCDGHYQRPQPLN
jgi:heat shock protein HspQ